MFSFVIDLEDQRSPFAASNTLALAAFVVIKVVARQQIDRKECIVVPLHCLTLIYSCILFS